MKIKINCIWAQNTLKTKPTAKSDSKSCYYIDDSNNVTTLDNLHGYFQCLLVIE